MKPIYHIKADTYTKAFFLGAIVSALAAGLAIEAHDRNIFGLYRKPEKSSTDAIYNICITVLLTGTIAFISYWVVRFLLGYGDSSLVR